MIDITGLTISELDGLIRAAQERKSDLEYVEQFSQLISVYQSQYLTLRDAVKVEGARWREPDPARYETWYAAGDIVTHDGKRYESAISFNVFAPDTAGAWKPA